LYYPDKNTYDLSGNTSPEVNEVSSSSLSFVEELDVSSDKVSNTFWQWFFLVQVKVQNRFSYL